MTAKSVRSKTPANMAAIVEPSMEPPLSRTEM